MVWDEEKKDYLPRWGYRRANNEIDDWVIDDKPSETGFYSILLLYNEDDINFMKGDYEDPFLKRKVDKRERIENQNKRQQANQKAATKQSASQLDPCIYSIFYLINHYTHFLLIRFIWRIIRR